MPKLTEATLRTPRSFLRLCRRSSARRRHRGQGDVPPASAQNVHLRYACGYTRPTGRVYPAPAFRRAKKKPGGARPTWVYNNPRMVKWDLCLLGACSGRSAFEWRHPVHSKKDSMFRLVGFGLVRLPALQCQHIELHRNGLTHRPNRRRNGLCRKNQ